MTPWRKIQTQRRRTKLSGWLLSVTSLAGANPVGVTPFADLCKTRRNSTNWTLNHPVQSKTQGQAADNSSFGWSAVLTAPSGDTTQRMCSMENYVRRTLKVNTCESENLSLLSPAPVLAEPQPCGTRLISNRCGEEQESTCLRSKIVCTRTLAAGGFFLTAATMEKI